MNDPTHEPEDLLLALRVAARIAPAVTEAARALCGEPWRIAVLGRVGAGKTTLVNRLTGADRPTGLGGVTRATAEVVTPEAVWLDTPGIDGRDAAIQQLGPVVAQCDAVLWVVDGLQPATHTEREVLEAIGATERVLQAVVGRMDLVDATEREAVLGRVQKVGRLATGPQGGDLRAWSPGCEEVLQAGASPRRTAALRHALTHAVDQLDTLPTPPSRAALASWIQATWRSQVQQELRPILDAIEATEIDDEHAALSRLGQASHTAAQRLVASLQAAPLSQAESLVASIDPTSLNLPDPRRSLQSPLGRVAAAMGGQHRAIARVRAVGAQWLADGALALADWAANEPGLDALADDRAADRTALERALARCEYWCDWDMVGSD